MFAVCGGGSSCGSLGKSVAKGFPPSGGALYDRRVMTRKKTPAGWSRREFLERGSVGLLTFAASKVRVPGSSSPASPWNIYIFSKHLQWLDFSDMAEVVAELGAGGVDLTVRPGGHVVPERVEEDLPRAVEAFRSAGLEIPMITTAITDPDDPLTERIVRTAAGLGIRYYRTGYYRYEEGRSVAETLDEAGRKLEGLSRLGETWGVRANYQNHAGRNYFGASLWDLRQVLQEVASPWLGCQFDIRHAAVEGGLNWPVDLRAIADFVQTAVVKDFRWEKSRQGWRVENCPLGEGMVDFPEFFDLLGETGFSGPISVHFEYPLGGAESGARQLGADGKEVVSAMRRDLGRLKQWLGGAA